MKRTALALTAALALILTPLAAHAAGPVSTTTTRCKAGPGGTVVCPGGTTPAPTPSPTATRPAACKPGPGGTWRCPGGVRY